MLGAPANSMNELAFGKYRVRELLARGGMAEIHLAVE